VIQPARGKVLVKRIETAESLPGGRIFLTPKTREDLTAQQVEVVAIGAPAYCDSEDCERPHLPSVGITSDPMRYRTHTLRIAPSDWVLLAPRSLSESGEDGLYICNQDDVLAVLTAEKAPV